MRGPDHDGQWVPGQMPRRRRIETGGTAPFRHLDIGKAEPPVSVLVDFAPHTLEFLREEHAHRRLGFADAEVAEWCGAAGLDPTPPRHLVGDPLTVVIWTAHRHAASSQFRPELRLATPAALVEGELH